MLTTDGTVLQGQVTSTARDGGSLACNSCHERTDNSATLYGMKARGGDARGALPGLAAPASAALTSTSVTPGSW